MTGITNCQLLNEILLVVSNPDMVYLAGMFLFTADSDLGNHRFTAANEKFTKVYNRAFTKSDAWGSTLVNLTLDWRAVMQQPASKLFVLTF